MTGPRALLSVSDKSGIVELAQGLVDAGYEIVSSGGTAKALAEAGIPVQKVGTSSLLRRSSGARKNLHPKIHGGILADRSKPEHLQQLDEQGMPRSTSSCATSIRSSARSRTPASRADAVEQIDIGGPAMVRAAAKNFHSVAVVVNPAQYGRVLEEIRAHGEVSAETRRKLAHEAFQHTGAYDAAIARYLMPRDDFPGRLVLNVEKVDDLRYGENPHQVAAFYRNAGPPAGLAAAEQLHGKELSYNNLLDTDAAWRLVTELGRLRPRSSSIEPAAPRRSTDLPSAYRKASNATGRRIRRYRRSERACDGDTSAG